jgi:uncharacterized membrane protein
MNHTREILRLAIASVITIGTSGCSDYVASLNKEDAHARGADEQCYGIARSGQNDCKSATVICAGYARTERDPTAYIYLPTGTCGKITGGRLTPKA